MASTINLSHKHEESPALARIADRFGSQLHAPAAEAVQIGQYTHIDVPLSGRHVESNGVEVIPTPGHTPGSTCYLVTGAEGETYLFAGDTTTSATMTDGRHTLCPIATPLHWRQA
jgi:glyoxylase-like metal-dependent hydrolase (beta-lactamase superfamily II)